MNTTEGLANSRPLVEQHVVPFAREVTHGAIGTVKDMLPRRPASASSKESAASLRSSHSSSKAETGAKGAATAAEPCAELELGGERCATFGDEAELCKLRAASEVDLSALRAFEWAALKDGGGKGGNLMAFTPCRRYLVKEVNTTDHSSVLKIATRYVEHILNESGAEHRDSLLARIFAHVRRPSTGKVYLVMNNWLPPMRGGESELADVAERATLCLYDLKGGTADDKTMVLDGQPLVSVRRDGGLQ